ncbi:MAG: cysteine--tRNA ligase [Planctomycetia bacterium]|nr:cysteine--tRNA ligase [Planctomycetia bacterium]
MTIPATESKPVSTKATRNIRVYSTLSGRKEPMQTVQPGKVGIYLCGPTVYKPSHIGHMVGPVIFDVIKRYLTYCGYQVTLVVNVTDIDDKLIHESKNRGLTMPALAEEMTADYLRNLAAMGVDTIDHFPRATANIDGIIRFTQGLIDKGFAYVSDGDVYFEVGKDSGYGKLSRRSVEAQQGEGGEMAARKRAPGDFALWKGAKAGEPAWDSPWGKGRPGWHIECSVMSHAILGKTFDIHGGGLDLVFPHHENEIAQSESLHGQPQAKYWLHNGLMQAADEVGKVGGRQTRGADAAQLGADQQAQTAAKISKSKGAGPFRELLAKHAPEAIRLLLISTHYRSPILFSEDEIVRNAEKLETFYRFFKRYQRLTGEDVYTLPAARSAAEGDFSSGDDPLLVELARQRAAYLDKMDDDFNTAGAIGHLFEIVTALNRYVEERKLEAALKAGDEERAALRRGALVVRELGGILGLFRQAPKAPAAGGDELVGKLVGLLIELRNEARKTKNFAAADKIRNELAAMGVKLEDRAGGTDWSIAK